MTIESSRNRDVSRCCIHASDGQGNFLEFTCYLNSHNSSKCKHEYCFKVFINKFRNFDHLDFSYRQTPESRYLPTSPSCLMMPTPIQSLPDMREVLKKFGMNLNLDSGGDFATDDSPLYTKDSWMSYLGSGPFRFLFHFLVVSPTSLSPGSRSGPPLLRLHSF